MKEILSKGFTIQIDDEDFERVSQYKWNVYKAKKTFYATANDSRTIYLHRFIMDVSDRKIFVDHKDRNGLNCQKENLRLCNNGQNMRNSSIRSNNKSGYKGVHKKNFCPSNRHNWRASLEINGKSVSIGYFDTPEEAAYAYDEAAKEYFGEFASTNF